MLKIYPSIGEVTFVKSRRARRLTLSVKPWRGIRVTLPWFAAYRQAENFLLQNSIWIKEKLAKAQEYEKINGVSHSRSETAAEVENLRKRALAYLPGRTAELAQKHGFSYRRITIRCSRTRWGSCSAKNNINLSIFLMNLPAHLIDYVIVHELVHTVQKNHSPAFWNLLEHHTGNARALAAEMKKFRISI